MLIQFISVDAKAVLDIDNTLGEKILTSNFPYKYIPSLELKQVKQLDQYTIKINNSDSFSFEFSPDKTLLTVNTTIATSMEDIVTLVDYYLDYIRQLKDTYCIHGNAVTKNKKAALLIGGASGIGKSTVALELVEKFDYLLVGDEKVLIDSTPSVIGGISRIHPNKDIQSKNLGAKEISISISKERSPIGLIIQPVTNKNGQLYIEKWEPLKTDFHLYEELSRKIRGVSRRINNFSVPIMSFDDVIIAERRSIFCKQMAKDIYAYTVYGDPKDVANKINELIENGLS